MTATIRHIGDKDGRLVSPKATLQTALEHAEEYEQVAVVGLLKKRCEDGSEITEIGWSSGSKFTMMGLLFRVLARFGSDAEPYWIEDN